MEYYINGVTLDQIDRVLHKGTSISFQIQPQNYVSNMVRLAFHTATDRDIFHQLIYS